MTGAAADPAGIDWERMAEPRADGYDTGVILRLAAAADPPLAPPADGQRGASAFGEGGPVARPAPPLGLTSDTIVPAAPDHPNLAAAARLISRWPVAFEQFKRLIDTIYAYTDPTQAAMGDWALGSSSHSHDGQWGRVYVTVDDPLGLAQALVHETAHQKLVAMGVRARKADRLIINDPGEGYAHPHFSHPRQPMTAVFHEQYTFVHVVALNLHMLAQAATERERQRILMLLARNVTRMEGGHDEVRRHVKTDSEGGLFVAAFLEWSTRVLRQGRAELDSNGYGWAPAPDHATPAAALFAISGGAR